MGNIKTDMGGGGYSDRGGRGRDRDGGDRDGGRDRDRGGDRDGGKDDDGGRRSFHRKKVCRFCADNDFVMDYKDQRMMQSFVTEHGKIVPRRISGNCAHHQRKLTVATKRARNLAIIGYVAMGN